MNTISNGLDWAKVVSILWLMIAVIGTLYKQLHPYIQQKISNEKNTQLKQTLEAADNLAAVVVPEMAVMAGLSKADRKKEAIRFVSDKLTQNGVKVSQETLSAIVEKAYQEYKHLTKGDNHSTTTDSKQAASDTEQKATTSKPTQAKSTQSKQRAASATPQTTTAGKSR